MTLQPQTTDESNRDGYCENFDRPFRPLSCFYCELPTGSSAVVRMDSTRRAIL